MPAWLPELAASVFATIIAITLHEAAHGYAARALGDDTAERAGRLSLNPIRHVDMVGTILLPGFLLVSQLLTLGRVEAMFGWAKPVPVNIWQLRNPRYGMVAVAAAGPATNFALALAAGLAAHVVEPWQASLGPEGAAFAYRAFGLFILANLVLGFSQGGSNWRISEFMRIDNLADKQYIGSVIVNDGNLRFFEPSPGRNVMLGVQASLSF